MTETKPFLKPADKILLSEKPWIIAAPMNGGINNPRFAASVINAGGIGSFGFTYHTPEAITRDIMQTRELINTGYINANFFIYTTIPDPTPEEIQAASAALEQACGYKPTIKTPTRPYHSDLHTQIEAIWQTRPEILTFHFGIPDKAIIREAQKLKILVGITATTLDEAQQIQEAGADFVVAQGLEAGGHRGRFYSTLSSHQSGNYESVEMYKQAVLESELKSQIPDSALKLTSKTHFSSFFPCVHCICIHKLVSLYFRVSHV